MRHERIKKKQEKKGKDPKRERNRKRQFKEKDGGNKRNLLHMILEFGRHTHHFQSSQAVETSSGDEVAGGRSASMENCCALRLIGRKLSARFEYDERIIGFIKDFRRVFYQASTDHRGTPEYPGRVVTLEAKEREVTWGAAYRVSGHDNEKLVLSYLDLREQEYDQKAYVNLYTADCFEMPALSNVLVYIGSSDTSRNKFWAGPAPLELMAEQIAQAVGPSGPNYEYLFLLEESLRKLDCVDEDICELAEAVRKHMNSTNRIDSSAGISGTNITTETQSISRKQQHDVCNGV